MIFNFPGAGGCVDGGKYECEVADGDVSGCQGSDLCLFEDEGEDSQEGVGGCEENEKKQADFKSLETRVHFD